MEEDVRAKNASYIINKYLKQQISYIHFVSKNLFLLLKNSLHKRFQSVNKNALRWIFCNNFGKKK